MEIPQSPFLLFRSTGAAALLSLCLSGILISCVIALHVVGGIGFDELIRDPIAFLGGSIYTGFLSQVGILLWAAVSAICIFGSYCLPYAIGSRLTKRFLLASGLLTSMLGLDDAFLLHEKSSVFLGISEKLIFLFYMLCTCAYLAKFYRLILKTEYPLLGMAFCFFGLSILLDVIEPATIDPYLLEDSAKIAGIISFLMYFFRLGVMSIHHAYTQNQPFP